jgi:hypothetical protein
MTKFSAHSFIIGLMVGVLGTGAWVFNRDSSSLPQPLTSPDATSTVPASGKSSVIAVKDQPAGNEAVVESLTVRPPGVWIAVRDVHMSGDLGNTLGAARAGGPRTNFSIPLLRATQPGRSYAVELYRDDNNGNFDPSVNSVYVDFDTGARVVSYFTVLE